MSSCSTFACPGGGGLRAAREISRRCAPTKVVALSAHEDSDTVIGMISAGASAYVPEGRFDGQDPADDPSNDRRELRGGGTTAAAHPDLPAPPPANAAEHGRGQGHPGRRDHRRVRTDRGPRSRTCGRLRGPAARGDPPSSFLRHVARRCGSGRPAPRHGDGSLPSRPPGFGCDPGRPLPRVRGHPVDPDRGTVPSSDPPADRRSDRVGTLAARSGRRVGARGGRSERDPWRRFVDEGSGSPREKSDRVSPAFDTSPCFRRNWPGWTKRSFDRLGRSFSSHSIVAALVACASDVGAQVDRSWRGLRGAAA